MLRGLLLGIIDCHPLVPAVQHEYCTRFRRRHAISLILSGDIGRRESVGWHIANRHNF